MRASVRQATVERLRARGFDNTVMPAGRSPYVTPRCSQCEVVVINGTACHESGCPNVMRSCEECGELIPRRQRICEGCADRDAHVEEL